MKAIVTGSNGFIGFNLCMELKRQGWSVTGIDDLSSGLPENVVDGFDYVHTNVQNKDNIENLFREFQPDVVFHLAAIPRVSYSVENPFATAEANVLGTVSVLEAIVKADLVEKTRIVNTSSSAVYGGASVRPTPETHPLDPKSPYALEKSQGEQWLELFSNLYGVDALSLRYFNVFGPHSIFGGAYSTVLSAWLYHLYVDPDYEAFVEGDGSQSRDFCYVDNVVQANILAATREHGFSGQAFNIAQGKAHTLLDCQELLGQIAGKELKLAPRAPRVGDVKHTLADISAAQKELGYSPSADFEWQLTKMAEWYEHSYPRTV
jgi:UDP-glucose 4-epimerase